MERLVNSIIKFKPKHRKFTFCCAGIIFGALGILLLASTNNLPFSITSETINQVTKSIISLF